MAVPDSATFLTWSGKTVSGSLTSVCDALDNYRTQPTVETLYIIYKECEDWKKGLGKVFSSSSERQKESAVNRVLIEVFNEMNMKEPGLGDALKDYEFRKAGGTQSRKFASLGAGYMNERKSYLAGGKAQSPFSGTLVHTAAEDRNKNFKTLSVTEFDKLGTSTGVRMYFLNKVQRLRNRVTCDSNNPAGSRWMDIGGNLVHTKISKVDFLGEENACQMWAMDRYGNLFVDYDNAGYGQHVLGKLSGGKAAATKHRGQMNHSSFCAGREVICAGNIFFWKGQLLHIDNGSGHYAPNRQALYSAVSILWNEGAELNYLRVGVMGGPTVDTKFYKGQTFLANGSADWPSQDWKANQNAIYNACPLFLP